jgi:NAD+ synthase (glutamine-hydrolysing)
MDTKIGVAQVNVTLGDFAANREKILLFCSKAHAQECDLVVFPEATLFGYHPFDLLEQKNLVQAQLKELRILQKEIPKGLKVIIGLFTLNPAKLGRPYFNSAALLERGKAPRFFHKNLLPTGDVFDEARFIETGDLRKNSFQIKVRGQTKKGFLTICEDIWAWPEKDGRSQYEKNPLTQVKGNFDFIINLSASPYYPGKLKRREELVMLTSRKLKAPMLYCNLVGAQDEIVFDGGSFVIDTQGKKILQCEKFAEDFKVWTLPAKGKKLVSQKISKADLAKKWTVHQELRAALVLGIRDFCSKIGLQKIHLGLSGGVDSALVACLAVEALGAERVRSFYLPGPFSSSLSQSLGKELAQNLNVHFQEISIGPSYEVILKSLESQLALPEFSVVHENLQARLRGLFLMAISNLESSLLLTTGNKSEYATGYSTLYGDMCGGLAPIADLTKKQVYDLCREYNSEGRLVIPEAILTRAPTAELKEGQKDQDSLPPYEELDASVMKLVEKCETPKSPVDLWLLQALSRTEFKRWQAAPILKVSRHSFGRGRRYPIAYRLK